MALAGGTCISSGIILYRAPLTGLYSLFALVTQKALDNLYRTRVCIEGVGGYACREERDKGEREAKEKEWAAQEAERSGEWYYKEVRRLFRHSISDRHPQEGLAVLLRGPALLWRPHAPAPVLF